MSGPGVVDARGLKRQCARLLTAGVHGIFALGTTGEGAYLSDRERRRVVEIVVSEVSGEVPVLVGALDTSPDRVAQTISSLVNLSVDGYVVAPPSYGVSHALEVRAHFELVSDQTRDVPLIAYDIPAATGVGIDLDVLVDLAERGIVQALKDSTGDQLGLRRAIQALAAVTGFSVMTGSELMVDEALQLGAAGAVPGFANVFPESYLGIYDAMMVGDFGRGRALQDELLVAFMAVTQVGAGVTGTFSAGIGAFKAALVSFGVFGGRAVAGPLTVLSEGDAVRVVERLGEVVGVLGLTSGLR